MTPTAAVGATDVVGVSTGVRLGYRDVGEGEPLLLIMGAAGSVGLWGSLEARLADSHRVISFDHRGLGGSERGEGPITTASMADDAAALLAALGITQCHVLGWSLGSAVAQELALRHPRSVASLVLLGTWERLDGFQGIVLGALRHPWDTGDAETAITVMGLCFSPQLLNAPDLPQRLEPLLPMFPQTPDQARVVSEQWDAVFAHDTHGRLEQIGAPTLVLAGEQDLLTPPRQCEAVQRAISAAEIGCLDGAGSSHAMHTERTAEVAQAVQQFLDQHRLVPR